MEKTMRRRSCVAAGAVALLLLWGTPGIALAETDVVLSNESEGSEVQTGESTFTNSDSTTAQSGTHFSDPPAGTSSATQGTTTSAAPVSSVASAPEPVAPSAQAPSEQDVKTLVQAEFDRAQSVAGLFVGLPTTGGSILP